MNKTKLSTINDVFGLLDQHEAYRSQCLNLIASENLPSPTVRKMLTSDLGGRYPTYMDDPAKRNYMGTKKMAELEIATQELAKQVYGANFIDFRPLGGHMAGVGVISALTKPGDTVFETGVYGGHLTATKLVSASLLRGLLNVEYIPFNEDEHIIDMEALKEQVLQKKPRLVLFGRDQILFPEEIEPLRSIADDVGAVIAYDFSHTHGLVAGKAFPNPLNQGADVVLGSHHKTIPGPQGGLYMTRDEGTYLSIRPGLYPPFVTNHHVERLPALAITYLEILAFGEAYAAQIVKNSQALGQALHERGIRALYSHKGFSKSHQVIVDVADYGTGQNAADQLEMANIISGKTMVPRDVKSGWQTTSGLRLGTQEVTRQGFNEEDMEIVAEFIQRALEGPGSNDALKTDVTEFVASHRALKFCFDEGVDPFDALWKLI